MKTDRLIGILSVLLQKDRTTAPELAELFEVSRRTISRDIDALCLAGIPIETTQGTGGGIRIMDGYRMDRTILTSKEMKLILAGLRSLDSVSGSSYYKQLMEKLQTGSSEFVSGRDNILIDLSAWSKNTLSKKIEHIQEAMDTCHTLSFTYYSPQGESSRTIEPYYLVFRWSSWYVWGWCQMRRDYRLFKLTRMDRLSVESERFEARSAPLPDLSNEKVFPPMIRVSVLFESDVKWRLMEEYGPDCFEVQPDRKLRFTAGFTDPDNFVSWILTFGDKAEVLEPEELRDRLAETAEAVLRQYRKEN